MTLPVPNLDDRKFQDIVSEARSKIPLYCPKWTDYNLSDPGVTLIELFAWMTEMLLYRLNQVPDKNYIKFMDLIGIRLEPPKPAIVDVSFRISAPQPEPVTIPRGTEVATVRTETQDAVTFTTSEDFIILIPALSYALTTPDDAVFTDIMPALRNQDLRVPVFQEVPQEKNALYLGYGDDLRAHTLVLIIQSNVEGFGVDPQDPPWSWEYWDGDGERWTPVRLESDTTGGFNSNGQIVFRVPINSAMKEVNGQNACWIRCRATKPRSGQNAYSSSPRVRSIISESIGCTVAASQALPTKNEFLGRSDGIPGQTFQLQSIPVLSREEGETVEVEAENEGEYENWREVNDFADSGPDDPHFTCDSISGEIQFGPVIRQPTGEERQYGKIPPKERRVRFTSYRSGGGIIGNVGAGTITVLKSSIPYVDSVRNYEKAEGGIDAETLKSAKLRAPRVLRANTRAVTTEDFERMALEASLRIVRAKCIAPGIQAGIQGPPPGTVRLLLVPGIPESERYITPEQLEVPRHVQEDVSQYLDERRLLTTRLEIAFPQYVCVVVTARVRARRGNDHQQVANDVERRLYRYINPICGGADGKGWPFGRSLILSEVFAVLQGIEKVDYIEEVNISFAGAGNGSPQENTKKIDISLDSLFCSGKHEVTVIE